MKNILSLQLENVGKEIDLKKKTTLYALTIIICMGQ